MKVYTIGHSTLPIDKFNSNLKKHNIKLLVDVRSIPKSRWNPQYNRQALADSLEQENIEYIWRGENLGGKLDNVGYDEAIDWLVELSGKTTIAIMCSEGKYIKCHRHLVIEPDLKKKQIDIIHINTDGSISRSIDGK